MARFNRDICKQCKIVFVKEKENQDFCSYVCEQRFNGNSVPGERLKQFECQRCQRIFNSYWKKRFCSEICKKDSTKPGSEDSIAKQNKLWLENNQASHRLERARKKIPFDVLQNIAEKKRVYGKKAWDHYLKGRKWDRI